jgi:hypothetical protein
VEIPVLLEPLDSRGYRATSLAGMRAIAEAPTREEAMEQVRQQVSQQLAQGEIVRLQVPVPGESNPWAEVYGRFKDHPDWDEVQENIRRYREVVDRDPNRP